MRWHHPEITEATLQILKAARAQLVSDTITANGLGVFKTEVLYNFDEQSGFSLGQVELILVHSE